MRSRNIRLKARKKWGEGAVPLLVEAGAKKERAIDQGEQNIRAAPADRSQPQYERRREISGRPEDS